MLSKLLAIFLIVAAFLKSLFYGIYELKNNKNTGEFVIIISIISLFFPIITILFF